MSQSVCIVETSYIVNEGLKQIVSTISDFKVQALFDSFQELENDSVLKKCNMVVCNPELIRSDRSLTKFRIQNPQVKVLVVDQERNAYKEFLNPATVDGYIFLCCDTEEVLKAILAVSKGEKFFCEKALGYMLNSRENLSTCSPVNLSERELEILKLITEGYSSKEISSQLFVSFHTVATHRKNICRKLGVNKVGELIAAAHKLNLA